MRQSTSITIPVRLDRTRRRAATAPTLRPDVAFFAQVTAAIATFDHRQVWGALPTAARAGARSEPHSRLPFLVWHNWHMADRCLRHRDELHCKFFGTCACDCPFQVQMNIFD